MLKTVAPSNHQSLHLVLDRPDLILEVRAGIRGNGHRNDLPAHTTCATESDLRWDVDVRNVLVFAEEREM